MARTPKTNSKLEVDALRHQDSRVNIPTTELADFIAEGEVYPYKVRYPRDPELDPQLVWKGKDEQNADDLTTLAVPIYIQEKIQPQAIIEEVRRNAATTNSSATDAPQQMEMFSDFNGIEFEQLIEFYQHEQHWQNRMILGDSLLVMTSLAEKEALKGKVQMIYLDPPYGIKFGSNWQVSTRKRDVKDGREEDLVRQPEQVRAFRDTWEKGIHSYLSYLRDRLVLARELLTESGSMFVQIGDENVHLVRSLLDEVFGSENFVSLITLVKTSSQTDRLLPSVSDYLLWYAKDNTRVKYRSLYTEKVGGIGKGVEYRYAEYEGVRGSINQLDQTLDDLKLFRYDNLISQTGGDATIFPVKIASKSFLPSTGGWKTNNVGMNRLLKVNRVATRTNSISYVRYLDDFSATTISNIWDDLRWGFDATQKRYVVETNPRVVQRCLLMTTDPGDLVLDPTMGSGTTAYVAEQWGRRWITVDTSRVALALARTRLMSARYPFYLLADSPEGARKEMELSGKLPSTSSLLSGDGSGVRATYDVKRGFVYERVPHITLRDIANNEEIDLIHERWQPYLEERRHWLNEQLGRSWEEWEVPRDLTQHSTEIQQVLTEYWEARRERQREMDASIQRNSERETLYDRPYEDKKRVRVAGPFTVESLSPHRILDPGSAERANRQEMANIGSYEQMLIDNLLIAGVQNTRRDERLKFDTLETYSGVYIHAMGTFTDANGEEKRVAVSIGSEHGTVGTRQIKEAAKEAVKGLGVHLLLICGFAFDAVATEESKRYGNLNVQIVRVNNDLMMGSILKQTDRANLFTIFGEPDMTVETQDDGRLVIELRGLDIYDPTTGQIRSSSTDDIACWFVDTAYNDESFFVRHAYFLGKDDAYDNLKRALRAEIDESAWQLLYSTRSIPFDRPSSGRIAVKVINHYGDEVLKVMGV